MHMIRKKDAMARHQPPKRRAGMATSRPMRVAAPPPMRTRMMMSSSPWMARMAVSYPPKAYMKSWPN